MSCETVPLASTVPPRNETTFIFNGENVFTTEGSVSGPTAALVSRLSIRSVWYGFDTVVVPAEPPEDFHQYTKQLGGNSNIIVPDGVSTEQVSMLDGLDDRRVAEAIRGKSVTSYVGCSALYKRVSALGGSYIGGDPGDVVRRANDKSHYADFCRGMVEVAQSEQAVGLEAIATAVYSRLQQGDGKAFVRLTHSGGGLGNYAFSVNDKGEVPTLDEITTTLLSKGNQDWSSPALVEEYLDLTFSPAVSFGPEGFSYHNLQITQRNDYRGSWSPVPPELCDLEQLEHIGDHFARELQKIGYHYTANTDLGLTRDGRIVGFEINARMTGTRHAIAIGELLLGPWATWQSNQVAIKSLDHFVLREPLSFEQAHGILDQANLLATPENPFGVVITVPPQGHKLGVQFHGHGEGLGAYQMAQSQYEQTLDLLGDRQANWEDHPLIT